MVRPYLFVSINKFSLDKFTEWKWNMKEEEETRMEWNRFKLISSLLLALSAAFAHFFFSIDISEPLLLMFIAKFKCSHSIELAAHYMKIAQFDASGRIFSKRSYCFCLKEYFPAFLRSNCSIIVGGIEQFRHIATSQSALFVDHQQ